jgi:hypothetical protein
MTNTVIGNSVNLEGNYWGIVRMGSVNHLNFFFFMGFVTWVQGNPREFLWNFSHGSTITIGSLFCGIFRMGPR